VGIVIRDRSGEYTYYLIDEYEERRIRDYDDRYNGRDPFGPTRPGWQPSPPPWQPSPPPKVYTLQRPPVVKPVEAGPVWSAPEHVDELIARLNAADPPPAAPIDRSHALAILGLPEQADADQAGFDLLMQSLPARTGENAAFDALFDRPNIALTAQEALAALRQG
jgi:hypothetical protein